MGNTGIYYIYWNKLFDVLIGDNDYELINFDTLIENNIVKFHGRNWEVPSNPVNSKDDEKIRNVSEDNIVDELKRVDCYCEVMDCYNNMLNHKNRTV